MKAGVTRVPERRPHLAGADAGRGTGGSGPAPAEQEQVRRLRAGDERAFAALVDALDGRLRAAARMITPSEALIEEAIQETWLAVIRGIDRFEGRSSLATWIYRILLNRARSLAVRERRLSGPPGAVHARPGDDDGPDAPEPGMGADGRWQEPPVPWDLRDPDAVLASRETFEVVTEALECLPERQALAVLLRDVEGLPPEEACNILDVSGTNLRVLLHRGRRGVRRALDRYLREGRRPRGAAGHGEEGDA